MAEMTEEKAMEQEEYVNGESREKNVYRANFTVDKMLEMLEEPLPKHWPMRVINRYFRENVPSDDAFPMLGVFTLVEKDGEGEVSVQIGVDCPEADLHLFTFVPEAGNTQEEVMAWLSRRETFVPFLLERAKMLSEKAEKRMKQGE